MARKMALRQASRLMAPLRREQWRAFSTSRCQHTGASEAASRLLDAFAGAVSIRRQLLDANQIQKLALTLGRPALGGVDVSGAAPRTGTPIPPGHHLVYFTAGGLESELGPDGTDLTFNAAEPFTRRMWAGGKMSWPDKGDAGGATLLVGDEVEEHTRLLSATVKKSRSAGEMVLVEVEKEIRAPRGYSVIDRRSWIFRPEIDPEKVDAYAVSAGEVARGPTAIQDIPADGGSKSSFPAQAKIKRLTCIRSIELSCPPIVLVSGGLVPLLGPHFQRTQDPLQRGMEPEGRGTPWSCRSRTVEPHQHP